MRGHLALRQGGNRLELLESKTVYDHVHGHHFDNQNGNQAAARLSTFVWNWLALNSFRLSFRALPNFLTDALFHEMRRCYKRRRLEYSGNTENQLCAILYVHKIMLLPERLQRNRRHFI
jgi:hypothetical protein